MEEDSRGPVVLCRRWFFGRRVVVKVPIHLGRMVTVSARNAFGHFGLVDCVRANQPAFPVFDVERRAVTRVEPAEVAIQLELLSAISVTAGVAQTTIRCNAIDDFTALRPRLFSASFRPKI